MADGQIIIDINADPAEFRRALDRLRSCLLYTSDAADEL